MILQQALSKVGAPFVRPEKNVFFYENNRCVSILIVSLDASDIGEYVVSIKGLVPGETYLYCKKKTIEYPQTLINMFDKGRAYLLSEEFIPVGQQFNVEYGEITGSNQISANLELKAEQIVSIHIQKLE